MLSFLYITVTYPVIQFCDDVRGSNSSHEINLIDGYSFQSCKFQFKINEEKN